MQYTPAIPFHPTYVLSYDQQVMGTRYILSTPTLLESTSFVVTFGLDVFCSLVTPSQQFDMLSDDFNKAMLLVTLIALSFGVAFTGPMLKSKKLDALWK